MRKIMIATIAATALVGWNAGAIASTPPAHPADHGSEQHEDKEHHDEKGGEHHEKAHAA